VASLGRIPRGTGDEGWERLYKNRKNPNLNPPAQWI